MKVSDKLPSAILAGGLGTRLGPIAKDLPKSLVPVHGRPFIDFLLDQLHVAGISDVVLCSGHLGEKIRRSVGTSYKSMRVWHSQERQPLGTGGALRLALPLLPGTRSLVMNGDSFCSFDLRNLRHWHEAKSAMCSVLLTRQSETGRYGQVTVAEDESIIRFSEKSSEQGPGWINAGIYLIEHTVIESIPTGREISLEREIFPKLIGQGLFGYRKGGRFLDIGTPESYCRAASFFGKDP